MTKQVRKLTSQQQKSIRLFLSGSNDTEVAAELGVARQTVNNWKNKNQDFAKELDRQQQELNQENRLQLSGWSASRSRCYDKAWKARMSAVRQSTAVHVLKATGFYPPESRDQ